MDNLRPLITTLVVDHFGNRSQCKLIQLLTKVGFRFDGEAGVLCLDFVTHVKQDPFTPKDWVRFQASQLSSALTEGMLTQFIEQRRKEINAACRVIKEKTAITLCFGRCREAPANGAGTAKH